MAIQDTFDRPGVGKPGEIADNAPHYVTAGVAHVASGTRAPRPGDAVYYDNANDGWVVSTSDANNEAVRGVVRYIPGTVPTATVGGGDDDAIQYGDGDSLEVVHDGVVYLRVVNGSTALARFEHLTFDHASIATISAESNWNRVANVPQGSAAGTNDTFQQANDSNLGLIALDELPANTTGIVKAKLTLRY